MCLISAHIISWVTGVCSRLNSATGTPLAARAGAYAAAGCTTEDVPTYGGEEGLTPVLLSMVALSPKDKGHTKLGCHLSA